ncbi:MAG: 1-deoxy-D-xylulose-5-phosphate synthase [Ignavibacteria bacterium RIFCSPLOWO2_02_FULL_55_14]|nr:MAG: 1-deoxy-D-xylulose-5-phosphate synthase [Ignavibacteria bacterium RIFCSPLOWO2_02_FULL_55_14]
MTDPQYSFLSRIDSPADLRKLTVADLRKVSAEVRDFLVDCISKTGGHFGAGLGAVELAVALHYAFNTPDDKLVWDTGHQAYPHKILTGRRDQLHTIRHLHGLSGFLRRAESPFDVFGAGHASTAISAALGIAAGRDFAGKNFKVVSIVGDGSLTGGMAYEAMNNAGLLKKDMIVVLNDNQMVSLSSEKPNLWSFHNYFNEMLTHPTYNKFKANVWDLTGKLDTFGDRLRAVAHKVESGLKAVMTPGMLFEALGFRYFGPFNGHNVVKLVEIFRHVQELKGPILVHVVTIKGKGYGPAEKEVTGMHGVTPFDKITGVSPKKANEQPAYTTIFGKALVEICRANPKVVGITAAMPDGTGLIHLDREMPERFFDVGIAEQHAVTFAAGLATEGYIPVTAIYSTFLQRAYDQVVHDCALQSLHVVLVLDRGGLVGADGPTHHGSLDLAYLRCVQGMVVMSPKDEQELRDMLYTAVEYKKGPIAMRYPRGNALGLSLRPGFEKIPIGKGETLRTGKDIALLAVGPLVNNAMEAAELLTKEGIEAEVVNMRFVKPLDLDIVSSIAARIPNFLTIEDNVIQGGFGSAVLEGLQSIGSTDTAVKLHGLPDDFVEHGTPQELYHMLKLDAPGIAEVAKAFLASRQQSGSFALAEP